MEKIKESFELIEQINNKYGLNNDLIVTMLKGLYNAKICIPIIGKFSSGKTALVNTLLGYSENLLKEDVTPETSVPAELTYTNSEERIYWVNNENKVYDIPLEERYSFEIDPKNTRYVHYDLRCRGLEKYPDIMLVDMPGFESGNEMHSNAIFNYISKSLAYIVAIPADNLIITESLGNRLKQLCDLEKPLCIVITKMDKVNPCSFDTTFEDLRTKIKKYIGDKEVIYCKTSSNEDDVREIKTYLLTTQNNSHNLLVDYHSKTFLSEAKKTETFLRSLINAKDLDESQYNAQKAELEEKLKKLDEEYLNNNQRLKRKLSSGVERIKSDVTIALESQISTFSTMLLNKQDISSNVNRIIESSISAGIRKYIEPVLKEYKSNMEFYFSDSNLGGCGFVFSESSSTEDAIFGGVAVAGGSIMGYALSSSILSTVLASVSIAINPILGALIGGLIGWISSVLFGKKRQDQKKEIEYKLRNEIIPEIMNKVNTSVDSALQDQLQDILEDTHKHFMRNKEHLEKMLDQLKENLYAESQEKNKLIAEAEEDLAKIKEIIDIYS